MCPGACIPAALAAAGEKQVVTIVGDHVATTEGRGTGPMRHAVDIVSAYAALQQRLDPLSDRSVLVMWSIVGFWKSLQRGCTPDTIFGALEAAHALCELVGKAKSSDDMPNS